MQSYLCLFSERNMLRKEHIRSDEETDLPDASKRVGRSYLYKDQISH